MEFPAAKLPVTRSVHAIALAINEAYPRATLGLIPGHEPTHEGIITLILPHLGDVDVVRLSQLRKLAVDNCVVTHMEAIATPDPIPENREPWILVILRVVSEEWSRHAHDGSTAEYLRNRFRVT